MDVGESERIGEQGSDRALCLSMRELQLYQPYPVGYSLGTVYDRGSTGTFENGSSGGKPLSEHQ